MIGENSVKKEAARDCIERSVTKPKRAKLVLLQYLRPFSDVTVNGLGCKGSWYSWLALIILRS